MFLLPRNRSSYSVSKARCSGFLYKILDFSTLNRLKLECLSDSNFSSHVGNFSACRDLTANVFMSPSQVTVYHIPEI